MVWTETGGLPALGIVDVDVHCYIYSCQGSIFEVYIPSPRQILRSGAKEEEIKFFSLRYTHHFSFSYADWIKNYK